jgi:hypothetical protein
VFSTTPGWLLGISGSLSPRVNGGRRSAPAALLSGCHPREKGAELSETDVTRFALDTMARHGSPRFVLDQERPDEAVRHGRRAIDFLARSRNGTVLAIEHTRIEPYEGFLADWRLAHERLGRAPSRSWSASALPSSPAKRCPHRECAIAPTMGPE